MIMKIAIVGSRNYTNTRKVKEFIFNLKQQFGNELEIVSGGQKHGADGYAKKFALEFDVKYSEFPPYHEPHNVHCVFGAYRYGKPYYKNNYHKRNEDIVNYSEKVVAFIKDDIITNGTKSTLEYCKKINKKFVILS